MKPEIIKQIDSLPPEAQKILEHFVVFLIQQHLKSPASPSSSPSTPLQDESFFGMWEDHKEMNDSINWTRSIRKSEWGK